ncbi:hypothetical protein J4212_00380 [Candidatus Woesearchaeota archaeon]|nr:hypothetical protein [Candidatus Woesearchaeota archaeon]
MQRARWHKDNARIIMNKEKTGREVNMAMKEELCEECGQKLAARETESSVLLMCMEQKCRNFWEREGAQIIMMLK